MKKLILALALAVALTAAAGTGAIAAAYPDVSGSALQEAVSMLSSLDVISGSGDGLYHPDQLLTRAQFAKIAVYMMGREEDAVSTGVSFIDVPEGHWATGYISLVSSEGVIAGYPDGTFGINDELTWSQAITIVVRILGYSGADVGYRWPDGYVEKARAIGLLDGITVSDLNAPVSRGEAALLCHNALFTDMKSGAELISLRGVTRIEDAVIIADSSIDVNLQADTVKTSAGNFKITENTDAGELTVGSSGDLYVNRDNEIVSYTPDAETVRTLIVKSTFMNNNTNEVEINYTENGVPGTESFALNRALYNEGSAMTMGSGYQLMSEGSELRLFYDRGNLQRAMLYTSTIAGPKIVESESFSPVREFGIADTSTLKVIRKGLSASLGDIKRFDVLYYAANTNTLYAYADSVTGIYEKAYPIKANVTSIRLSGTTYQLATQEAINRLNESPGAFAINDRVTLLKGRNDEIVGAVDADSADLYAYGVIQNTYTKISQDEDTLGRGEYWVTMFMADGTAADYHCDADYSKYIGELRKLNFQSGILSLEKIKYTVMTGAIDNSSKPSFNGHWFANDYGIIELVSLPDKGAATLRKVSLNELNVSSLSAADVIHVQTTGDMDDISILYLRGVTNEQYTYGVVKSYEVVQGMSSGTTNRIYTLLLGNQEAVINNHFSFSEGEAIGYGFDKNGDPGFISLVKVGEGKSVAAVTSNRIKVGDTIYSMSDNAVAYGGDLPKNYQSLSLEQLVDMKDVISVELYSDHSISSGGVVKVIVVRTNRYI